jgi:hypothetical protein
MPHINWVAVLACAVLGMIVPAIWYAPALFGKTWMEGSGLTEEDMKGQGGSYALAALCSVGLSWAMAGFLSYVGSQTFLQGALAGLQFWLGFTLTNFLVDYRFAQRPWKLLWINTGHQAVTMILTGGILAAWS